jgi:hypothetical protein
MTLQIDDVFVGKWDPLYPGNDEDEYTRLVAKVTQEMKSKGTISEETFRAIWKWKGAMRVIRHVSMGEYDTLYAEAFRRAAAEPPE